MSASNGSNPFLPTVAEPTQEAPRQEAPQATPATVKPSAPRKPAKAPSGPFTLRVEADGDVQLKLGGAVVGAVWRKVWPWLLGGSLSFLTLDRAKVIATEPTNEEIAAMIDSAINEKIAPIQIDIKEILRVLAIERQE